MNSRLEFPFQLLLGYFNQNNNNYGGLISPKRDSPFFQSVVKDRTLENAINLLPYMRYDKPRQRIRLAYPGADRNVVITGIKKQKISEMLEQFAKTSMMPAVTPNQKPGKKNNSVSLYTLKEKSNKFEVETDTSATALRLKQFIRKKKRLYDYQEDLQFNVKTNSVGVGTNNLSNNLASDSIGTNSTTNSSHQYTSYKLPGKIRIVIEAEQMYTLLLDSVFEKQHKSFSKLTGWSSEEHEYSSPKSSPRNRPKNWMQTSVAYEPIWADSVSTYYQQPASIVSNNTAMFMLQNQPSGNPALDLSMVMLNHYKNYQQYQLNSSSSLNERRSTKSSNNKHYHQEGANDATYDQIDDQEVSCSDQTSNFSDTISKRMYQEVTETLEASIQTTDQIYKRKTGIMTQTPKLNNHVEDSQPEVLIDTKQWLRPIQIPDDSSDRESKEQSQQKQEHYLYGQDYPSQTESSDYDPMSHWTNTALQQPVDTSRQQLQTLLNSVQKKQYSIQTMQARYRYLISNRLLERPLILANCNQIAQQSEQSKGKLEFQKRVYRKYNRKNQQRDF